MQSFAEVVIEKADGQQHMNNTFPLDAEKEFEDVLRTSTNRRYFWAPALAREPC
jgi:hypothetical protein